MDEEVGRAIDKVMDTIVGFFEAARQKDIALSSYHSNRLTFTKFDVFPPYTLQAGDRAMAYEEAVFANISDLRYAIVNHDIAIIGETALATFILDLSGIFIYDYSFEGRPVKLRLRVTMLLVKEDERWLIVHEHLSELKDMKDNAEEGS